MRIEDTDRERSRQEFEIELVETMKWLGLNWDEGPDWKEENGTRKSEQRGEYGPYRQSERTDIYRKYLTQLLENGKAYYCYCSKEELEAQKQARAAKGLPPGYAGHCRELTAPPAGRNPELVRFKTPARKIGFKDLVRGEVEFDTGLFDDFVLARSLESPLYNFAAVVDDHEMRITHVIRGEEHLSNTPKQLLIYEALGFEPPVFGHLPLILAADRTKLSKRYAETAMLQYREAGYLPEAMLNFLALLGWHPKEDREVLTLEEMIREFDLGRVQKAGAIFNPEKLDWLNAQHLKLLSDKELLERLAPFWPKSRGEEPEDRKLAAVRLVRERARTLKDFAEHTEFLYELPDYEPQILVHKQSDAAQAAQVIRELEQVLEALPEAAFLNRGKSAEAIVPLTEKYGKGPVFWPLRVAVSGLAASPDPLDIMLVLGKAESLRRIRLALSKIKTIHA